MDSAFRVVFLLGALASASGTFWLGISGQAGAAVTMGALAAIFSAFAFLTKFKRFKGLGFEGELWEQEMEQAAELRRGLEGLAEQLGESVAWQMLSTSVGWSDAAPPLQTRLAIVDRTTGILRDIGIPPARIDELNRPWHSWVMSALTRPIADYVKRKLNEHMAATHEAIIAQKRQRVIERPTTQEKTPREAELEANYHLMDRSTKDLCGSIFRDDYERVPRHLRAFIDQSSWLTDDDRQAIYRDCAAEFSDIEQYARDRTLRRPEVLQ
jgi:hypothetical protein